MSLRKYASLESVRVLDLLGSKTKVHHASLGKLADFEQYRTEDGYLYARIRAISSRVNKNHDGWPSIELAGGPEIFDFHTAAFTLAADGKREHGFSTFLGKPIFVDHHNSDPSRARGVIVDAKLHVEDHKTSSSDPYYSSRDVDPEHLPGTWIELLLEVDAKSFPKLAKAIVEGGRNPKKGIDGWSMGCDVEKSVCSICKNAASSPEDYCNHIRMKGAIFDFILPDGRKTSRRAYENCYGIKFFEISAVFDPADETALSHQITSRTAEFNEVGPGENPELDNFVQSIQDNQARSQEHMPEGQDLIGLLTAWQNGDQEAGQIAERITGMPPEQFMEMGRRMFAPISDPYEDESSSGMYPPSDWYTHEGAVQTVLARVAGDGPNGEVLFPPCPGCGQVAGFGPYHFARGTMQCNNCHHLISAKDLADIYNNMMLGHETDLATLPETQGPPGHMGKTQEETIIEDPKTKGLKDAADDQMDDYLDETERGIKRRRKSETMYPGTHVLCPNCAGDGLDDFNQTCTMCSGRGSFRPAHRGTDDGTLSPNPQQVTQGWNDEEFEPDQFGPVHQGNSHMAATKLAENPLPQSELYHAPEKVDTLREEEVCPVCGSSMDEDTCDVCGYQEPPEGFDNPDLTKAQAEEPGGDVQATPDMQAPPTDLNAPPQETPAPVNTPNNPTALSHVNRDMDWQVPHTAARINKIEKPLVSTNQPQTNEPQERILEDQTKPVTSKTYQVRTAEDFIAAAGATRRNMKTADTADSVAKPDVHTDVIGVGGVDQASNDAASKANAQVDVLGIGSTGVDSVSAEKEGVNVEQGDEHSKNIEAIPTKTWSGDGPGNGDSLGQQSPVTSETPSWIDESKWSSWHLAYDDGPFPAGEEGLAGGTAAQGNQPIAESFGERVNVLEHVTSPSNNSGPTKTWTGTEGNGVNKQQDPVTPESIARGESGMEDAPNWTASTHIFAAFKLADMEVDLGLITPEARYARAAELERESSEKLAASLQYAQRIKRASHKVAGTQRLPVMGRSDMEKDASVKEEVNAESPSSDDSFMFGGV